MSRESYEGTVAPDSITPFIGVRAWRVQETFHSEPRLFSMYKNADWPIDRPMQATCIKPSGVFGKWFPEKALNAGHEPPVENCECGIYALNSPLADEEIRPWRVDALVGIVLLWGRVLMGERGYRSEYAKLIALYLDSIEPSRAAVVKQMSEVYMVPVVRDLDETIRQQRTLQGGTVEG